MPNFEPNSDWMKEIKPLHLPEDSGLSQRIQQRVQESLQTPQKQEESIMKERQKHRIRPLFVLAAVIGIGAASLVTADAATNGELLGIRFFVNGEEYDGEVAVSQDDDGSITFALPAEDGDCSVSVFAKGDVSEIEQVEINPSEADNSNSATEFDNDDSDFPVTEDTTVEWATEK